MRSSRQATASGAVGMTAARMSSPFEGRWVYTIVRISPMRAASHGEASCEVAASSPAPKKIAPT